MKARWSWPGVVALAIGGSLGIGWCAAIIIAAVSPYPTSSEGINMIGALGQTLAGAVAAYLGYQVGATTRPPTSSSTPPDDAGPTP